jgi:hypothetical protein
MMMNKKKIIYSILKEIEKKEVEPKAADYGLTPVEFMDIALLIRNEGLADNVAIASTVVWLNKATLTMKGLDYLEQNSVLAKTYKGLKEMRDWLKL